MSHGERRDGGLVGLLGYLALGVYFGVVLTKGELVSWFRIQEMFRFAGFYMYGVLGVGVLVGMVSLEVLRRFGIRGRGGCELEVPRKERTRYYVRYWAGGFVFGLGWALLGACPGPIYALIGSGSTAFVLALLAAIAGARFYAAVQTRLPH